MHNGGIEGFNTTFAYLPDDKVTVVVLSNMKPPAVDELEQRLGASAHGRPGK